MSGMRQKIQYSLALEPVDQGETPISGYQGTEPFVAKPTSESPATAGQLMEEVCDRENLVRAWKRVRSNQGSPGVDGMTIDDAKDHLREHWPSIRSQLLEGTYQPKPVKRVEIPKPDGGVRKLGVPCVVDRLIQQALLQVLQKRWDPTFSEHSYGFRPGRSAHQAVAQAQRYIAAGYSVVVDLDLEKFFDRVNHDSLMARVAARLTVNETKSAVARPEERKFLGFSISNDGSERRIAPKALDKFKTQIRDMTRRTRGISLPQFIDDLTPYLIGWRGYFGFCQTPRVLTNLEAWIRRRLRSYLWWQWQNGPNRFKELRRRGVPKFQAAVAAGSPTGFWRMSGHPAVQQALRNPFFDALGLPRLYVSAPA